MIPAIWKKLGGEMNRQQLETIMRRVLEDRRAEVRAATIKGKCPRCDWKATPGMTAQLEYEVHLANHQIEALLSNTIVTQG